MPTPISPSGPSNPFSPIPGGAGPLAGASGLAGGSPVAGATTPKLTGIASLTVDGVDITAGALGVRAVKPSGPATEAGGIQSQFPLHDLSLITTEDRYAQGFRLDSGSLRLMWMSARRTTESDGTPGFEIYFQAHGAAVDRYKKRLEQAGATSGTYQFFAADPDPAAPDGKSTLKKNSQKWNPSSATVLTLSQAGKWDVELVSATPEAIKGGMRIRVHGPDADATAALQEVVTKLGLQTAFAPPKPEALEKLKIMRLLWQISSGAADKLRFSPRQDVAARTDLKPAAEEADASAAQAIASADLSVARTQKRVQLAALLYDTSPRAFLDWAKGDGNSTSGILPSSGSTNPDSTLETALTTAGIPTHGEKYAAALASPVPAAEARALLMLGLLAKKTLPKAEDVAGRDVEGIKLGELHDLCAELGVSSERIAGLRFDEVYPGYFTVVDPTLSGELEKKGARYLYSTSDNPERVWQMLTGGQKSSLTRFQEGLLIQGKSSSRDFETGGASSVFSRLVTESVITKAKKGESGYETTFNDWSGSRPYKLVINRKVLDRTDWYGFNGDNFGRTTALKPENHGEKLISTINGAYSRSNEICFPVGNDTAFIDYVTCSTDAQKKSLIDFLEAKGITEWRGKPLTDFVIVSTKVFEHPDDVTLLSSARDALVLDGLKDAVKAAEAPVKAVVDAQIAALAPGEAQTFAEAELQTTGRTRLEQSLTSSATSTATAAVNASGPLVAALGVDATKAQVQDLAASAAKDAARPLLENLGSYSTYALDSAVRSASQANAQQITDELATTFLATLVAAEPAPADASPETKKAVRAKLEALLRPEVRNRMIDKVLMDGANEAETRSEALVVSEGPGKARSEAQKAARGVAGDAAVAATDAAALAALVSAAELQTREKLSATATSTLTSSGPSWLRPTVKTQLEAKLTEHLRPLALPAAAAAVIEAGQAKASGLVEAAHLSFAAKQPAKVTPELVAALPAQTTAVLTELAEAAALKQLTSAIPSASSAPLEAALKSALAALGPGLVDTVVPALAQSAARTAAEVPIRNAANTVADAVYQDAIKAAIEEVKVSVATKLMAASLDRVGQALGDTWANWAVNNKLSAAVDAVMAKHVPPATT